MGVGAEAPTRNGPGLEEGRAQEELGRWQEARWVIDEWTTLAKEFKIYQNSKQSNCMMSDVKLVKSH